MRRRPAALLAALFVLAHVALGQEQPVQGSAEQGLRGQVLAEGLILFGAVFILAAALGMLRFPDFYTRLHASTKLVTLGGLGILGGAALAFSAVGASERVLLIAAFFLLTAPLSGYMIAHSGYLGGLRPFREDSSVDEWQECGALAETVIAESRSEAEEIDRNQ
ncbi:MAG: monovalent cation/H(+) antiporter subunit G [Trueperaceae bacterium]